MKKSLHFLSLSIQCPSAACVAREWRTLSILTIARRPSVAVNKTKYVPAFVVAVQCPNGTCGPSGAHGHTIILNQSLHLPLAICTLPKWRVVARVAHAIGTKSFPRGHMKPAGLPSLGTYGGWVLTLVDVNLSIYLSYLRSARKCDVFDPSVTKIYT